VGAGGIGDDLLCTTVIREFKKRHPDARLGMLTNNGSLFEGNPDVEFLVPYRSRLAGRFLYSGLPMTHLYYSAYDPIRDSDAPLSEHLLITICRMAGITGPVELKPWFHLSPAELAAGRRFEKQIVIQSSSLGSPSPMKNKAWYPERFQAVASGLCTQASLIQLGAPTDPLLEGALDLRGKTTFRESAAILANSLLFVGGVGFLMHLARAVDCRSAIVYGGRETPQLTGYSANANLTGPTPCSPCWLRNDCDFNHECMNMISAATVLETALEQIARHGSPLQIDTALL
jgi:ADP-heptose:LPS heptosyltransferase